MKRSSRARTSGRRRVQELKRSRRCPAVLAVAGDDKVIHLMRHGVTEMNVYLSTHRYGSRGFRDPMLVDTRLTDHGKREAAQAAALVRALDPAPELLVLSPLTRALETATLAFGADSAGLPTVIEPLFRERLYLSSDVGRSKHYLIKEFPHYATALERLPSSIWWHSDGSGDEEVVVEETDDAFACRILELKGWLRSRPERCIAVVTHWGVSYELTGVELGNCEIKTVRASEFLP